MTSRERVIAAINHQPVDRCPIDLGSNGQTGINASTLYKFRKYLGLDEHPLNIIEPYQMLGEVEEDLMKVVGNDVIGLWNTGNMLGYKNDNKKSWQMDDGTPVNMGSGFEIDINEKGEKLLYPCGDRSAQYSCKMPAGGSFFDNIERSGEWDFDLDEEELTPVEDFKEDFAVASDEEARYWEEKSKKLYDETDYAIIGVLGGAGFGDVAQIPGPSIRNPKGIRRIEDWLMAHAMYPGYVDDVFGYQEEIMLKNLEIYKQAVGDRIQVIWVSGTDLGTQKSTFTSLDTFRKLYKPHFSRVNDWIHKNTGWKTFYHSCGCVAELLDDIVDMGVDCLNPVQFSALENKGVTPQVIKEKYGDKLTFWGGGVDTQKTLPFGTSEEVFNEVKSRVEILNNNGGYVFSSIHNIVANVPVENLRAMYEAVLGRKLEV